MMDRIKDFLARHMLVVPIIFSTIVLCGFVGAGAYYTYKNNSGLVEAPQKVIKDAVADARQAAKEVVSDPEVQEKTEEFVKNPPKTSAGNINSKSIKTTSGTATVVSTGGSAADSSKIQSLSSKSATSNFTYVDKTGSYPQLGAVIKEYLETKLLKGTELNYFYELDLIDCAECDYGGYWTGSYIGNGTDITKAFGYITLNIAPYKNSSFRDDYMKLIFSHEYGHHYTMYHRWVDMDLAMGERFPDQYYNIRPLAYGVTATDYSLGWGNCDAEIIAEDYSYFYSGYGYSGVASAHGYPSNPATKNYLVSMNTTSAPTIPAAASTATPTPAAPPADTTAPTVRITSPANQARVSANVNINANASDDVGVAKVLFLIDGQQIAEDTTSPYGTVWNSAQLPDGSHTVIARAWDAAGNHSDHEISVIVSNEASVDREKPTITISEPLESIYNWNSGNLRLHASATDNVGVGKIQLYINDSLVAEESDGDIVRIWMANGVPAGSYILKARAYDAAGNWAETSITIIKS